MHRAAVVPDHDVMRLPLVGEDELWLRGELDTTPQKLAAWECERMPAFLLAAYDTAVREGWKI